MINSFGGGSEYSTIGVILTIRDPTNHLRKGNSHNLAIYGNIGFNIFKNSTVSLFARNDDHKQTGSNMTYS